MKKFIFHFIIIILSSLLVLTALEKFYDYQFTKNGFPGVGKRTSKHYDYLVLGDSRVCSVRSSQIGSITGLTGLTISNFGSSLGDLRGTLEYFIHAGNTTRYLFLSIDPFIGSRNYVGKEFLYIPFYQRFTRDNLHFPFARYAKHNHNYSLPNLRKAIRGEWDPMRRHNPDQTEFERREIQFQDHSERKFHVDFLKELDQYCKEKKTTLILFTPPYTKEYLSIQSDFNKYKHSIASTGIPFYDYSGLYGEKQYFVDDFHLNRDSEVLFTLEMAEMVASVVQ